jgi:prevent-host-death family protein
MAIIAMSPGLEDAVRTVNVADLKNRLSAYLKQVREGEEILVKDRTHPVALIVPLPAGNDVDADMGVLVASGKARPPRASLSSAFWALPAPRIPLVRACGAVSADRDESA